MKHTIVIELPGEPLPGRRARTPDEIERGMTAHIQMWAGWPVQVVAYHREDITTTEDEHVPPTYAHDVQRWQIEARLGEMQNGDRFRVEDPDGQGHWEVTKYSSAEDGWYVIPADGRERKATRAEVLEELFPS